MIPREAEEYVRCRTSWQGHAWDDAPPSHVHVQYAPKGWLVVSFRCIRCGMSKYYQFNPKTGECSKPRYWRKPKNYATPGVTRGEWKALFTARYAQTKTKTNA